MRKTKMVIIHGQTSDEPGHRDDGKTFLITEMSARQAEAWADRAFLAIAHSSVDLHSGIERSGMAGISQIMTLLADTQLPNADALMGELVSSVRIASIATTARLNPT